ncbi:hypothetical protein IWZ03DRAFT_40164 [Phyllosticta citriasiana]|uniref:Amine oxidase domain-containing protein n=1 Tax=Phyllosticta citriasiana TaxID=595635 RepID=A0ABR1KFV7_9PEZI
MFALMKELKLTAVVQRAEGKDVVLSKDGQVELVSHGDPSPTLLCWRLCSLKFRNWLKKISKALALLKRHVNLTVSRSPTLAKRYLGQMYAFRARRRCCHEPFGEQVPMMSAPSSSSTIARPELDSHGFCPMKRMVHSTLEFAKTVVLKRHFSKLSPSSVLLSAPVKSIHQHKGGDCEVRSTTGLGFRCKKVVVSISSCLYPMIEFDPPLPQAKKDLSESTTMCYYSKFVPIFSSPW